MFCLKLSAHLTLPDGTKIYIANDFSINGTECIEIYARGPDRAEGPTLFVDEALFVNEQFLVNRKFQDQLVEIYRLYQKAHPTLVHEGKELRWACPKCELPRSYAFSRQWEAEESYHYPILGQGWLRDRCPHCDLDLAGVGRQPLIGVING